MKNKKKIGLNLKKVQISKLGSSTITGGRAHYCTGTMPSCHTCETDYRSCTDYVKQFGL